MTNRDKLLKKNHLEGMEIDKTITEAMPFNEEIAILRKTVYALVHGQRIPDEFDAYYNRAEAVKAEVKNRLN